MPEGAEGTGGAVIAPADPREPGARALLCAHRALMGAQFEAHRDHGLDAEALAAPGVRFVLARRRGGRPLGRAALAVGDGHGEVSMFVAPEARGSGLAPPPAGGRRGAGPGRGPARA